MYMFLTLCRLDTSIPSALAEPKTYITESKPSNEKNDFNDNEDTYIATIQRLEAKLAVFETQTKDIQNPNSHANNSQLRPQVNTDRRLFFMLKFAPFYFV